MNAHAPWHAHIYFTAADRAQAAALRDCFSTDPRVLFTGRMVDGPIGPHSIPQYGSTSSKPRERT